MGILRFSDMGVFETVTADTPSIGECRIDVTPCVAGDGACSLMHPWADEDMAEFEAYWQDFFADGRLAWGEKLPEDWEAMESDVEK